MQNAMLAELGPVGKTPISNARNPWMEKDNGNLVDIVYNHITGISYHYRNRRHSSKQTSKTPSATSFVQTPQGCAHCGTKDHLRHLTVFTKAPLLARQYAVTGVLGGLCVHATAALAIAAAVAVCLVYEA